MLAAKGPVLKFERGLSAETCFLVRTPIEKAIGILKSWTPVGHPSLNVAAHGAVSHPPTGHDFQKLGMQGARLPEAPEKTADRAGYWTALLRKQAVDFQSGGLEALAPYSAADGKSIAGKDEAAQLLQELPKLKRYFAPILKSSGIGSRPSDAACYWEFVAEEDNPSLILGAVTTTPANGGWQALDLQYYASSGFIVGMTFYQLWPIRVGGTDCTLVWRCNAVSAPEVATLGEVERRMAGVAYKNRVRKYAEALREALQP